MFIIYPDRVFFNHFFYVRRSHFVFLQTKSIQHDRLFHLGKLSCTRGNRIRSGSGLPSGAPKNPCMYLACKGFHVFMQKKGAVTQRPDLVSCATAPLKMELPPLNHQAAVAVMTVVAQPISFEFKGSRIKLVITALFLNELFMVASLDYPAVIHYHDDIGILYRR